MDAQTIQTLISSLGFPIIACGYLAWMNEKQDRRHAEEVSQLTQAVNNNTVVMQKLADKIEGE